MQSNNSQINNKKRIKYNAIENNKYYYLRFDENETGDLYILVKEKSLSYITYLPIKIRDENNEWFDFAIDRIDFGDKDNKFILTKKEINARNNKIMILE